jgi:hypothetical protein
MIDKEDIFIGIAIFIAIFAIAFLVLTWIGRSSEVSNCPDFGTVEVRINGENICVPWEKVADFDQFKE